MRPIFTLHAGEFLVGEYIEKTYRTLNVWIPSKDTGIDLLVTNASTSSMVSLQVKLSRDYKPAEAISTFDHMAYAQGWLTLSHKKIAASTADQWVFVVVSHERTFRPQFIVLPPSELLRRLVAVHGESERYNFYPWVTKSGVALDGRGLSPAEKEAFAEGVLELGERDLSPFLNNWEAINKIL